MKHRQKFISRRGCRFQPGLLEPIGNIPPAEAEAAYYADMQEQAIAA
jgi:hypothetical protein